MASILRKARYVIALIVLHPRINATIIRIFGGRLPSHGFVFDVNNPYVSQLNAVRIFWRDYEVDEINLLHKYLRRDLDVIELGSGIGVISVMIASKQAADHKLVCVETNPFLIETLEANLRLNAPEKKVIVRNKALDYSGESELAMQISKNNLGNKVGSTNGGEIAHVQTTTLAEIIKSQGVGNFALVSDIEGAEAGILVEDAEALANCHQMLIELHPAMHKGQKYSVEMLREKIVSHGFRQVDQRSNVYVFTR